MMADQAFSWDANWLWLSQSMDDLNKCDLCISCKWGCSLQIRLNPFFRGIECYNEIQVRKIMLVVVVCLLNQFIRTVAGPLGVLHSMNTILYSLALSKIMKIRRLPYLGHYHCGYHCSEQEFWVVWYSASSSAKSNIKRESFTRRSLGRLWRAGKFRESMKRQRDWIRGFVLLEGVTSSFFRFDCLRGTKQQCESRFTCTRMGQPVLHQQHSSCWSLDAAGCVQNGGPASVAEVQRAPRILSAFKGQANFWSTWDKNMLGITIVRLPALIMCQQNFQ